MTPEQREQAIEKAARALAHLRDGESWSDLDLGGNATSTRDDEYRDAMRDDAETVLDALAPLLAEERRAWAEQGWDEGYRNGYSIGLRDDPDALYRNPYRADRIAQARP